MQPHFLSPRKTLLWQGREQPRSFFSPFRLAERTEERNNGSNHALCPSPIKKKKKKTKPQNK